MDFKRQLELSAYLFPALEAILKSVMIIQLKLL